MRSPAEMDIPGYPGYRVTEDGTVVSYWRNVSLGKSHGTRSEICDTGVNLKQWLSHGYPTVTLKNTAGKFVQRTVHTLVLLSFCGPRPSGLVSRHLNGNPQDNRITNLKYGTPVENRADTVTHGTELVGESHPNCKLSSAQVNDVRSLVLSGRTHQSVADQFGVSRALITKIANRKARTR